MERFKKIKSKKEIERWLRIRKFKKIVSNAKTNSSKKKFKRDREGV